MQHMSDDWELLASPIAEIASHCKVICEKVLSIHDIYKQLRVPERADLYRQCCNTGFRLPDEIISQILLHLDASSLFHVSITCKLHNFLSAGIMPGLRLRLFPHQFTSGSRTASPSHSMSLITYVVWWMRDREANRVSQEYLFGWRQLTLQSGDILSINCCTGACKYGAVRGVRSTRGGLVG